MYVFLACSFHNDLHLAPEDIEYGLGAQISFCFAEDNTVLEEEDMTMMTSEG